MSEPPLFELHAFFVRLPQLITAMTAEVQRSSGGIARARTRHAHITCSHVSRARAWSHRRQQSFGGDLVRTPATRRSRVRTFSGRGHTDAKALGEIRRSSERWERPATAFAEVPYT